ncbi:hypothetical protein [Halospina sp. K52047b]|uniref:hypothetical protein n=1 Tax=Halospina sp. K52047b TaxID=2614160 RepID=UPI00124A9CA8|nr:hypothetical protein [Halospina sp. K52047b]KAA8978050.1 hypothetical protein F3089_14325 [Halospina sp. K52047b]
MPSKRVLPATLSLCLLSLLLTGCSDGSSGGSGIGDQITLPGDSPIPETPIREDNQSPTSPTVYTESRFWAQGKGSQEKGLFATPKDNNGSDEIDSSLLAELPVQTVPTLVEADERLAPRAVFYRTDTGFALAHTYGEIAESVKRVSNQQNTAETCLGGWAYDLDAMDNTSVAYHSQRNTNDCPERSSVTEWKQVRLGDDAGTTPQSFPAGVTVVAGLNNSAAHEPQWLTLESDGTPARYDALDLSTSRQGIDTANTGAPFTELHMIGRIGTEGAILAYTDAPTSDTDRNYQLTYYDRTANSISDLPNSGGPELKTLPRIPNAGWIAPGSNAVFFGIGNALVRADADGYRIIDSVDGPGRPYFVSRSATHVIWGLLKADSDSPRREIRVVGAGGSGASTLVRAPYVETRVRGTADGWFYFTAARGTRADGRLRDPFAIGYNPATSNDANAFILANAQWIGSSIDQAEAVSDNVQPQALASAPITDLFYRGGDSDMAELKALIDPSSPLATEQGKAILPKIELGRMNEWNSAATAVFMGPGFGRQRLLTSVEVGANENLAGETELRVGSNRDLINRVHWVDPGKPGSINPIGNRGPLVRHVPLF